jgi:hypothetical protein
MKINFTGLGISPVRAEGCRAKGAKAAKELNLFESSPTSRVSRDHFSDLPVELCAIRG